MVAFSQKELATVLVRLGALSSAAEVLTRLEMWEELAMCYQSVGRKAKAREIVQQQLDREPTPSLLCLMGDIMQVGEERERHVIGVCMHLCRMQSTTDRPGKSPLPPAPGRRGHWGSGTCVERNMLRA